MAYSERWQAPAGVGATLQFRRALRAQNWSVAAAQVRVLISPEARGEGWVEPTFLRDAGVSVLLAVGDVAQARFVYDLLEPFVGRPSSDLRSRLLASLPGSSRSRRVSADWW